MNNLNFDFVKKDLLSHDNIETLILSVDFFISLEPKNIEIAINVVKKFRNKEINFDLDDVKVIIESLLNFKNFLLGTLIVEPSDTAFINKHKNRVPTINNLLSTVKTVLLSNGFNFRF